jgi:putative ABC transport system substrate-binding protein
MRRRDLMTVLVGAMVGWPLAARAQQKAMLVIGFLTPGFPSARLQAAFLQGLSENGYVEGQNVAIEYRRSEGHYDRLPALAADLVDRKVDVIVALGGVSIRAAKNATSTIPIVFGFTGDPAYTASVGSLARPGGNLTGVSTMTLELMSKRIQLLSELVPQAGVITFLTNPNNPGLERYIREAQDAASVKGVQFQILNASTEGEIDAAFVSLAQQHAAALAVAPDAFFDTRRGQLVALAARHGVPAIYQTREHVEAGGLISYGVSSTVVSRQIGIYVGKILTGAHPVDLPVEQPTRFELVINLNAAKALGLTIPHSMLMLADEVIE